MAQYQDVFMRSEIKYLLNREQYEKLRQYLDTIVQADAYGLTRINNIYFDTPDYRLVRTSLEKPVYKEKLRLRTYGRTDDDTNAFIEIKKKYKGVVYKRRISGRYADHYSYLTGQKNNAENSQIAGEIEQTLRLYHDLEPAMSVCYERIAMVGIKDPSLRITLDENISYDESCKDLRELTAGRPILPEGQCLMEIKVCNGFPCELARKMSELSIFPVSFSKYGRAYQDMMRRTAACERNAGILRPENPLFRSAGPPLGTAIPKKPGLTKKGVAAYV
ncbi:MAG: polyphosphate polymerase domain-containing protein [Lachnospiraceae bacterium]|nr:polyphosphate polymerase domain-containing protein [Lachnospiraceae bacterium]